MTVDDPNASLFFSAEEGLNLDEVPETEVISAPEGGSFTLYKCSEGGRIKVLKAIRESFRGDPLYEEMLRKEYEIGKSMAHPNIREYRSYYRHPEFGNCIEMEWVDGCPLDEMLRECSSDAALCDKLAAQLLDAVRFIHLKQVVHRDLKPSNILVTRNGKNIKLIDFSLSDSDSHSILKGAAGTALFAAPEQLQASSCDTRSDIYSLGVILSRMSARRSYRKAAAKCTRRDPAKRFQNIDELEKALLHPSYTSIIAGISAALVIIIVAGAIIGSRISSREQYVGSETIDSIFQQATELLEDSLD